MKNPKHTKRTKAALLVFLMGMLCTCCESFTEVGLPSNQLTTQAVFQDRATANAAMAAIYAKIRDTGFLRGGSQGVGSLMGNYTDEFDFYGGITDPTQYFYTNTLLPSNAKVAALWAEAYTIIYSANAVIEGVNASEALAQQDRLRLGGEALFARALVHFYLVNLYGPVPYITTTDYRQNAQAGRSTVNEIYTHLITDLVQAVEALPSEYPDAGRIRPNKAVARALLSRVYLFNQNWAEAAQTAATVIEDPVGYALPGEINTSFLKESPATIWQLVPAADGQNTEDGAEYILTATPPPALALSQALIDAFEPGDLRKQYWVGMVSDGVNTWYFPYKYKEMGLTAGTMEYHVIFRLSEQYLIRSEALAMLGDLSGAVQDLNVVRQAAGLAPAPIQAQQELVTAILQERRVELFTEGGHRFMDLKRTGRLDTTLTGIKPGWDSTDALMPIPESELLLNSHLLPQNPGY